MRRVVWAGLLLLLTACAGHRSTDLVRVGMPWDEVVARISEVGWQDQLTLFNLEKGFADQGGRMHAWQHPGGSVIHFSTLPRNGREVLVTMSPSDGNTVGGELEIIELRAGSSH